ncbi:MAG: peptidoglycan-associated lipoprotein [Rhodocyclales bacterium]|nr:peptidoglycan-associated lipoprotein [Rhodocyclales bacterium]
MKSLFITRFVSLVALVLLSACSTTGPMAPVENPLQTGANGRNGTSGGPGSGNAIGSNGIGARDTTRATITEAPTTNAATAGNAADVVRGNETQVGKSIYFDYNEFSVKAEYQDMLRQNFSAQRTRDAAPVRLEGNADERGSSEYNLALGQKRAEAVKKQLELLGVPEAQLEAVSFGSEKPRESCHEERCWATNRRVDLIRQGRQPGK